MTMFAFNPDVFQPVNTMNLYIFKDDNDATTDFFITGAYWAAESIDAYEAGIEDGVRFVTFALASDEELALFHTPDFPGRQVGVFYYVKDSYAHDSGFFYIVADSLEDAWKFAESEAPAGYETRYSHKLTRKEAGTMFEKGWNL